MVAENNGTLAPLAGLCKVNKTMRTFIQLERRNNSKSKSLNLTTDVDFVVDTY